MNALEFESKQQSMSDMELIGNVKKQISELARTGGRSHRMCAPPQVTDTDMILSEMVRRFELFTEHSEKKMDSIIAELKKDFSGDDSYLSGVNDGMYHLFRKHLIEKTI